MLFRSQVPGVQAADDPGEVANKYIQLTRGMFQNVTRGSGQARQFGLLTGYDESLMAQVMGSELRIRLFAVNDHGQGYVVVGAAARQVEPALRPLFDFVIQSFRLGAKPVPLPTPTPRPTSTAETIPD